MASLNAKWRRRCSGLALLIYSIALITGTHLPHPEDLLPIEGHDKWLHFGAYFGLAFLMTTSRQTRQPVTLQAMLVIWSLASFIGIIDELTQMLPGINRHCEFADWLADTTGAASGLLAWLGLKRLVSLQSTTAN